MDWLLDNVVGRLPRYDELTDNAKLKMALQGVVKKKNRKHACSGGWGIINENTCVSGC
ncbi:MAG: hypothetical protein ACLS9K_02740 [Lachnospira eligens]